MCTVSNYDVMRIETLTSFLRLLSLESYPRDTLSDESQYTQSTPTLTEEDGMQRILSMSLQFILDTTAHITLQKSAWSLLSSL